MTIASTWPSQTIDPSLLPHSPSHFGLNSNILRADRDSILIAKQLWCSFFPFPSMSNPSWFSRYSSLLYVPSTSPAFSHSQSLHVCQQDRQYSITSFLWHITRFSSSSILLLFYSALPQSPNPLGRSSEMYNSNPINAFRAARFLVLHVSYKPCISWLRSHCWLHSFGKPLVTCTALESLLLPLKYSHHPHHLFFSISDPMIFSREAPYRLEVRR